MDASKLFKGVAVIIDDEVDNSEANISKILAQIKEKNIPYLTYTSIPSEETISHFLNLSFLLLDWRLIKEEITSDDIQAGTTPPSTLEDSHINENIEFLEKLKDICFCPVFIFTNEDPVEIIKILEEKGVYSNNRPNHIFVKRKVDVKNAAKMFKEIEKWLKSNPSVYVLKEWEKEYQQSKNKLFCDFQGLSPVWPKIMWKNFGDDGANKSLELGELISRNLHTRMTPYEFSKEVLDKRGKKIDGNEMRRVLEGERFLKNDNLHSNDISTGDLFKISSKYYLNIRPACDSIPDRSIAHSTLDDVKLYLLEGSRLSDNQTKSAFKKKYGQFSEIDSQSIIFPLHDGNALDFRFKKFNIMSWSNLKGNRIGRILPPYINRIQQRYALFLQRQGLPRTPGIAI